MPIKNKNLEKAVELLKLSQTLILTAPNRAVASSDKYRTAYELAEAINNFLKSLQK